MTSYTINDAQTIAGNGTGTVLAGRYRIVRQLGVGGMGSVWLAEDTQLDGKLFAIKMLPSILVSNKRAYRQLKDEALVAMRLVHPNIVQIRAFEENNGNPFLVMDYVDGQTLDDYLAEYDSRVERAERVDGNGRCTRPACPLGGIPESEVIRILKPIAAALDYAHGEGVVHRDVKPANVMIRKDGHPFILDFGIAREIQETMTRVTGKLSSGTLLYMSPEQLNGDVPKKEQDIYSFAAMAYECLKGEPPFVRGAIEDQIKNKAPEPLPGGPRVVAADESVGRGVFTAPFASLAAGIMAGLAKKPEDRPKSCAAVLEGKIFNRVEHVERAEDVGRAGAPRTPPPVGDSYRVEHIRSGASRPKPSRIAIERGATKVGVNWGAVGVVAAMVLAAAGVGWKLYKDRFLTASRNSGRAENANVGPIVKPDPTEADVVGIAIEADVQKAHVERIDGADGFTEKKNSLADVFNRAAACRREAQWAQAAIGYTNYVNKCRKLVALDGGRNAARKKRTEAESAKTRAADADAEKYAKVRWNESKKIFYDAGLKFVNMSFMEAAQVYEAAAQQFDLCANEANTERERLEAEAKAKAEQEARERERRKNWRKEGEEFTINDPYGLYMTMKWCPAGTFTMGSPATEEGRDNDERQHEVTLTRGFWIGQTEVTQGQWKKLMDGEMVVDLVRKGLQDDTVYNFAGKQQTLREYWGMTRDGDPMNRCGDLKDDVPVYNVNWHEAVEFCRRLTQHERADGRIPDGYEYRLPTEAEWEYACRAGRTMALPNGVDIRILGQMNAPALDWIAWYGGNSSVGFNGRGWDTSSWPEKQCPGGRACAREVKGKQPNNWGLYDMIGNVWEWCGDWYGDYPYGSATDPTGAAAGAFRVIRGGGWSVIARRCRSAFRGRLSPGLRFNFLGFRVALAPMLPEEYREAIRKELQKANVVTKHEEYAPSEMPEKTKPVTLQESPLKEKTVLLPNGVPIQMVWCGPGVVKLGDSHKEQSVNGFWIGKYEVTQKQWASVISTNPSQLKDENLPVDRVTWDEGKSFVALLNQRQRHVFRLPKNYEWEYAAKGGHKGHVGQLRNDIAWWKDNSGDHVHLTGQKAANRLGVYDMLGNVWEWCENPSPDGVKREIRGGAYYSDHDCSMQAALFQEPDERIDGAGLRLVCDSL